MTEQEHEERIAKLAAQYPNIDRRKHREDCNLCREFLAGKRAAFDIMFVEACGKLEAYVKHCNYYTEINRQDKEDIISDTIEISLQKVGTFRAWGRFSTWMKGIARNRFRQLAAKKRKAAVESEYNDALCYKQPQAKTVPKTAEIMAVRATLQRLPKEEMTVVYYKFYEARSFGDIAKALGISLDKVKDRYSHGMELMREFMAVE
jgi:RNA polymerase sigma factor (sigma-70 family)